MESILRSPQWSASLCNFVTWCLMWDPVSRPTASQALRHEYFIDAVDPLRPRSSRSGLLAKKHMSVDAKAQKEVFDNPTLSSSRSSWFRKSIIRDQSPVVAQQCSGAEDSNSSRPPIIHAKTSSVDNSQDASSSSKYRPFVNKRATWTHGASSANAAPMPILPSIRPISPFSNTVTALAHNNQAIQSANPNPAVDAKPSQKIGRQLSVQSNGNHYGDLQRHESGRVSNGQRNVVSPNSEQKESFFSHLRKRARRLSGKPQSSVSPASDDVEASAGRSPRHSNRNSMIIDSNVNNMDTILEKSFENADKALQAVNQPLAALTPMPEVPPSHKHSQDAPQMSRFPERHQSLSKSVSVPSLDSAAANSTSSTTSRNRRTLQRSGQPDRTYDTPDEEDELLHEALTRANTAARRMDRRSHNDLLKSPRKENVAPQAPQQPAVPEQTAYNPYPTPSPSAKRNGMLFDQAMMAEPVTVQTIKTPSKRVADHRWPTPPYEENEWGASAAASIFAASSNYH